MVHWTISPALRAVAPHFFAGAGLAAAAAGFTGAVAAIFMAHCWPLVLAQVTEATSLLSSLPLITSAQRLPRKVICSFTLPPVVRTVQFWLGVSAHLTMPRLL